MRTTHLFGLLLIIIKSTWTASELKQTIIPLNPAKLSKSRFLDLRRSAKRRESPNFTPPRAICGANYIGIGLSSPFSGRLFTSHRDDFTECSRLFHAAIKARLTLPLNSTRCGVKRSTVGPNGQTIIYELRVIVSFDYQRLTEDDRIFDLKCIHSNEQVLSLDAFYDAKDVLPKQMLFSSDSPKCHYSLHLNSLDGGTVSNAKVGDMIYHKWQCSASTFRFRVYRCFVHNGGKQSFMLVDDKGCSLDEEILPHPKYEPATHTIYAPSKAFRFSKTTRVHFNCLLQVCSKNDTECSKTIPPHCPRTHHKRNLADNVTIEERLLRLQAALNGKKYVHSAPIEPLRLESSPILIGDGETRGFDPTIRVSTRSCMGVMGGWMIGLILSNILSIIIATVACIRLIRNKYSLEITRIDQGVGLRRSKNDD